MYLESLLESAQNRYRILDGRLIYEDLLEPPLKSSVFLLSKNLLVVLVVETVGSQRFKDIVDAVAVKHHSGKDGLFDFYRLRGFPSHLCRYLRQVDSYVLLSLRHRCMLFLFLTGSLLELIAHQDTAAVFADDDFLVLGDVKLALGRNLVEAAAAGASPDRNYSQMVLGAVADPVVCDEHALVKFLGKIFLVSFELLFFHGSLGNDLLELGFLVLEIQLAAFKLLAGIFEEGCLLGEKKVGLADVFLAGFLLELLELNLTGDGLVFAVVHHFLALLFVFVYKDLALFDFGTQVRYVFLRVLDFILGVGYSGAETGDVVFQVLDFQRKLAAEQMNLVDSSVCLLYFVQRTELFFH